MVVGGLLDRLPFIGCLFAGCEPHLVPRLWRQCSGCIRCYLRPHLFPSFDAVVVVVIVRAQATTPEFKVYQQAVVANSKAFAAALMKLGCAADTGSSAACLRCP